MDSASYVQLALKVLNCTQKELADRLGVSQTQITKWKKGDHLSGEMMVKFEKMTKIGELLPSFVLRAGSLKDARKWAKLILYLADIVQAEATTDYDTTLLKEADKYFCAEVFEVLEEIGVKIPDQFFAELDFDYENCDDDGMFEIFESNPFVKTIDAIFNALNDVHGFYVAYVSDLVFNSSISEEISEEVDAVEYGLLNLAASKVDIDDDFAPKLREFKYKTLKEYEKWLTVIKENAFRAGIPLRAELLGMVYESNDSLGHEAEAESLGFNLGRVHPDIYMNELIVGMRLIHQVLPAILHKLGIADEFEIDESGLRLGNKK